MRRLNSDQLRKLRRLRGSKNFISEREKLVLNTSSINSTSCIKSYVTNDFTLPATWCRNAVTIDTVEIMPSPHSMNTNT